jgi:hypothetical protein
LAVRSIANIASNHQLRRSWELNENPPKQKRPVFSPFDKRVLELILQSLNPESNKRGKKGSNGKSRGGSIYPYGQRRGEDKRVRS